ncbi:MAG: Copper-sensing transcriptional repressor CsoR [Pelotomaculum sp. PtaB.Bin013]|uniref:metal-sensitive transcriptional regulator n=1 Tax=Pelotomaculum isophthalicicum TaxID=342448 RepID=UPI0009CCF5B5|nr:MAG: Copper-sensing transcriptional repressor CsoR [Pelotomaculum sp. PtaB.Bin013]
MNDIEKRPCSSCLSANGEKIRSWRDEKTVQELTNRLNRIEGQIRGIKRMIEEGVYCDDILNQISSAQSALNGVAKLLLEKHMRFCIKEQIIAGDDKVIDELMNTIFRMMNK